MPSSKTYDEYAAELEACKDSMFDRYDIDGSGTLNGSKELIQLCTNLSIKLELGGMKVETIEQTCADLDLESDPWELDRFVPWFITTFVEPVAPKPVNTSEATTSAPAAESPPTEAPVAEMPAPSISGPGRLFDHPLDNDEYPWVMMFPQEEHERYTKLPWSNIFTDEFKHQCKEDREFIIKQMLKAGLSLKYHVTSIGDEYAVHIGATQEFLEYIATKIQLPVKFQRWIQQVDDDGNVTGYEEHVGYEPFDMLRKNEFASVTYGDEGEKTETEDLQDSDKKKGDKSKKRVISVEEYEQETERRASQPFNFRTKIKLQLVRHLIMERWEPATNKYGAGIDPESYMTAGATSVGRVSHFFPLHDEHKEKFKENWARFGLMFDCKNGLWKQPLNQIKDYFGEKIALYFSFLGYYTKALVSPTLWGLLCGIIQMAFRGGDNSIIAELAVVAYCCQIVVWATVFLENWKRRQSQLAHKWGMRGLDSKEQPMPGFIGSYDPHLDSLVYSHEADPIRDRKLSLNICIVLLCLLITAGTMLLFTWLNYTLTVTVGSSGGALISIVNSVTIIVLNDNFKGLASSLTVWENHRTETEFQDSLTLKCILFQFVCSFFGLYLVAFLKPWAVAGHDSGYYPVYNGTGTYSVWQGQTDSNWVYDNFGACSCRKYIPDGCYHSDHCDNYDCTNQAKNLCYCDKHNCQTDVGSGLMTLFLIQIFWGNISEIIVPQIVFRMKEKLKGRDGAADYKGLSDEEKEKLQNAEENKSAAENESIMPNYEEYIYAGIFDDYNELTLQFGFVTLFATNFPFIGMLAFINNIVEIRSDAFKFVNVYRRPTPKVAESIGTWFSVMEVMTFAAVSTNAANVFLVSDLAEQMSWPVRIIGLFAAEHCAYLVKMLIAFYIPDVKPEIQREIEYEEVCTEKHKLAVIMKKCDKDFEEELPMYRDAEAEPEVTWTFKPYPGATVATQMAPGVLAASSFRAEPAPVPVEEGGEGEPKEDAPAAESKRLWTNDS